MNREKMITTNHTNSDERGQSMVLIAFVLIGLLAFVGMAVDLGFWMARSSKLQAAVDSAALAGVSELSGGDQDAADRVAVRFLHANGVPISTTLSLESSTDLTPLNAREYALTATWDVELFFLKLIGIDSASVTKSATAAYFPLADVYVSERVDDGAVATSYQAVYGPYLCPRYGDPFSTLNSPWEPGIYTYNYRIMIPPSYLNDHNDLRVEILDPDSWAAPGGSADVVHSATGISMGMDPIEYGMNANSNNRSTNSLVNTGESALIGQILNGRPITEKDINYWWFIRMDVNYHHGAAPGDGQCGNGGYSLDHNSQTLYQLYYYRQSDDGTIERVDLAAYTGQTGLEWETDPSKSHDTNLRWVSPALPGVDQKSWDQTVDVPVDPGSPKGFTLNVSDDPNTTDVPDILVEESTGIRYLYLGLTAVTGSTQNGYELWAGPPEYRFTVPSNINARNVYLIGHPGSHTSKGATVYAMGRLPMKSAATNPVNVPLLYVGPEYAGQTVYVSQYDSDTGASPPTVFYFDTLAFQHDTSCNPSVSNDTTVHPDGYCDGVDWSQTDWAMSFGNYQNNVDPDGHSNRCRPGTCTTRWVEPPYEIEVPGDLEDCNKHALPPDGNLNADPDSKPCIPFYGGRLIARYRTGKNDVYGWEISLSGVPYLIK